MMKLADVCMMATLGTGPRGTHNGCGGVDAVLAMAVVVDTVPGGAAALNNVIYSLRHLPRARTRHSPN